VGGQGHRGKSGLRGVIVAGGRSRAGVVFKWPSPNRLQHSAGGGGAKRLATCMLNRKGKLLGELVLAEFRQELPGGLACPCWEIFTSGLQFDLLGLLDLLNWPYLLAVLLPSLLGLLGVLDSLSVHLFDLLALLDVPDFFRLLAELARLAGLAEICALPPDLLALLDLLNLLDLLVSAARMSRNVRALASFFASARKRLACPC